MFLELTATERDAVLELVEARIRELRVEVRHAQVYQFRCELNKQLEVLEHVKERFETSQWDVMA